MSAVLDNIYSMVPEEQKKELFDFRNSHPYKEICIQGKTWRYISCGQGEKALLMLPGGFMKADMWLRTALCFEKHYRIIITDNYALQDTFDMIDVCRAHTAILDAEGIEKATVIGVSGGAGLAQFFLQEYPGRVENIVFSHTGIVKPENDRRLQKKIKLIKILPYFVVRRILKKTVQKQWASPPSSKRVEFRNAYLREMGQFMTKERFISFMIEGAKAHRNFRFTPETVRSFTGRILILSSKGDGWTASQDQELRDRYSGAQTHVFEDGGHHTVILFPDEYNKVICDFLKNTV